MRSDTVVDRFWQKVDVADGCWEWQGAMTGKAQLYGRHYVKGAKYMLAHRFSFALHYGPFDRRMQVLHRCDNPRCVRPEHLFLGDIFDNMRDKVAKGRHHNQRKTECKSGHPFDEANTYYYPSGRRACRACVARWKRDRKEKARV